MAEHNLTGVADERRLEDLIVLIFLLVVNLVVLEQVVVVEGVHLTHVLLDLPHPQLLLPTLVFDLFLPQLFIVRTGQARFPRTFLDVEILDLVVHIHVLNSIVPFPNRLPR